MIEHDIELEEEIGRKKQEAEEVHSLCEAYTADLICICHP